MIAIQPVKGGFDKRWIKYCNENKIAYKLVNCYANDIVRQLDDCSALFWQFYQSDPRDINFAKQLLYSLQSSGKKVFPDFNTMWHFDDKVGQKYLLESIGAPLVPTWIFYEKTEALHWAKTTDFPKVFKLRGGAGSQNVKLVHTRDDAVKMIHKAFSRGYSNYDKWGSIRERYRKWRLGKTNAFDVIKGFARVGFPPQYTKVLGREHSYIYFQDFIPNNEFDVRIIVVGDKAMGEKRFVRKNDFRASGSGEFGYDNIDLHTVKTAFDISKKLKTQCVAFDFIYDNYSNPLVVEISYGFGTEGISKAPGYWDNDLNWYEGKFDPFGWMIEEVLK